MIVGAAHALAGAGFFILLYSHVELLVVKQSLHCLSKIFRPSSDFVSRSLYAHESTDSSRFFAPKQFFAQALFAFDDQLAKDG